MGKKEYNIIVNVFFMHKILKMINNKRNVSTEEGEKNYVKIEENRSFINCFINNIRN